LLFNLLIFILGVLVGWYIHIYFNYLEPPKRVFIEKEVIKREVVYKECKEENRQNALPQIAYKTKTENIKFKDILKRDYKRALIIYSDANSSAKELYLEKIYEFFTNSKESITTVKRLEEFLEIEPNIDEFYIILAKLYVSLKNFDRAIDILLELKGYVDIDDYLEDVIDNYLKTLKGQNRFTKIDTLLKRVLEENINNPKYKIELAKSYIYQKRYQEAQETLEEIDKESKYYKSAKELLKEIDKTQKEEYEYKIPLIKMGRLYVVKAKINGVDTKLLVDTGASISLINSDFLTYYENSENLLLNTVGGAIEAKMAYINLEIGELRLNDFRVSTTLLSDNLKRGVNGILGMDFFKHFNFQIDQKNSILLLSIIK